MGRWGRLDEAWQSLTKLDNETSGSKLDECLNGMGQFDWMLDTPAACLPTVCCDAQVRLHQQPACLAGEAGRIH